MPNITKITVINYVINNVINLHTCCKCGSCSNNRWQHTTSSSRSLNTTTWWQWKQVTGSCHSDGSTSKCGVWCWGTCCSRKWRCCTCQIWKCCCHPRMWRSVSAKCKNPMIWHGVRAKCRTPMIWHSVRAKCRTTMDLKLSNLTLYVIEKWMKSFEVNKYRICACINRT
jgi:hypothetical protein